MKDMTDRLLEGSKRNVEPVENGRLLMEQLAGEWEEILEDSFSCEISMENCTDFRAEWDMQEILRIFDNLSSNVENNADSGHPVLLQMDRGSGHLTDFTEKRSAADGAEDRKQPNRTGEHPQNYRRLWRSSDGFLGRKAISD